MPISIVYGLGISNLYSYRAWLPNKMIEFEGAEVPMLVVKGGGYSILTLPNNKQISSRGEDALMEAISKNFNEIKSCFSQEDFEITENKAFAEFDEFGNRKFEVEPDSEFERKNYKEEEW